jgi:alpha-L-fucosidase
VLYLHVFEWPATGELKVPAFGRTVRTATLLADRGAKVSVMPTADGVTLRLPATAPDPVASVVALQLQ